MSTIKEQPREKISGAYRASTGIEGLDFVLGGGLPPHRVYLVEGDPGTGKTTLALQFLMAGREAGERGLYVTLSETKEELTSVADSHGWSLGGIDLFELEAIEDRLRAEEQYTVFHPSEVELNETLNRVCRFIEQRDPSRVVIDSLSEMRLLARDPLRYRRQVLAMKQFFVGRNCTVLLLDDNTSSNSDLQLQSISHGVIRLEKINLEYGATRRRLHIPKLRGQRFRDGNHDVTITSGGLLVFPRLIAARTRVLQRPSEPECVSSGVAGLDALLGGGLARGSSTLILGPAGCGKSTLSTQYAMEACVRGERCSVYIFEETRQNYLGRARGMGMDLWPNIEAGMLTVDQIDPSEMPPGEFAEKVRVSVVEEGSRVVVIDSLNGYLNAMPSENFLLIQMHELLSFLNDQGVVTLLVLAQHGVMGPSSFSPVDMTYLTDNVVLLRYFEAAGRVRQAIAVLKKRIGPHERTIREFQLTPHGIVIGEPLSDFHGVLTGVPTYLGSGSSLIPGREPNARP